MPRVKGRGSLERSAAADLFKHTISRIPSVFGRVFYLAGLRDTNSGIYRHHGLSATFGRQESIDALAASHYRCFQEWLQMPLAAKHADLFEYFGPLEESAADIVKHWRNSRIYLTYMPDSATDAERELFVKELEILFDLVSFDDAGVPGRSS